MFAKTTTVATTHAQKYLRKLCIHWEQRFEVKYYDASGTIDFGNGQKTQLLAAAESLTIIVSDRDASRLDTLVNIVESHLKRYSRREVLIFQWQETE